VGGHAVRLNGFLRSTETSHPAARFHRERQARHRGVEFFAERRELQPEWFREQPDEPENIRVADDLLIDLCCGERETYDRSRRMCALTVDVWT